MPPGRLSHSHVTDEGKIIRSEFESISAFTLIAATNEPGQLKAALRTRLVQVEFEPYSEVELKAVAERVARQRGVRITPQAARRIAEVAQGVPDGDQGPGSRPSHRRSSLLPH